MMVGVVTELKERTHLLCRHVSAVLDDEPVLDEHLLWLTRWLSQRYLCSWGKAIWAALPPGLKRRQTQTVFLSDKADCVSGLPGGEGRVLSLLASKGPLALSYVLAHVGPGGQGCLAALEKRGLVVVEARWRGGRERPRQRRYLVRTEGKDAPAMSPARASLWEKLKEAGEIPSGEVGSMASASWLIGQGLARWESREAGQPTQAAMQVEDAGDVRLTDEQSAALRGITSGMEGGGFGVNLLFGVTASGKTEVYIRAVRKAVDQGRRALVLVPEIGLVSQMASRLSRRFSGLGVWHSELSDGERYDVWDQCRRGRLEVVVGVRSAVFAPLPNLGLVVVDEEHDASYQQRENEPLYHAREAALARAEKLGIQAILGSATPSAESFHRAGEGAYRLHTLASRPGGAGAPRLHLVDCRGQQGRESLLSPALADQLRKTVSSGEQAMLLLNRRGFARSVQCRRCGSILRCRNCDISLTYHRQEDRALCHYCGFRMRLPAACPACGSGELLTRGGGIQRLEDELRKLLPGVELLRMDSDTTGRKGSHERILSRFGSGGARVLIGTQMISKGHHFPGVTLVGILDIDDLLGLPDFRGAERASQLLVQMSGRAGRGLSPGLVMVQTRLPGSAALGGLGLEGYRRLLEAELEQRRAAGYPPYKKIVLITVSAGSSDQAGGAAEGLAGRLRGLHPELEVLGPAPAPIPRLRGRYRFQVLLKHPRLEPLLEAAGSLGRGGGGVTVRLEVEPVSTL